MLGIMALTFCLIVISSYFSTDAHAATWDRQDILCPDKVTEKTRCIAGGVEQCEAKYCHPLP